MKSFSGSAISAQKKWRFLWLILPEWVKEMIDGVLELITKEAE